MSQLTNVDLLIHAVIFGKLVTLKACVIAISTGLPLENSRIILIFENLNMRILVSRVLEKFQNSRHENSRSREPRTPEKVATIHVSHTCRAASTK